MHYRRLNRSYRKTERDKDPDIVWIFVTLASLISFTHYKGPTAEVLLVILYTLKYSQFRKSLALSQEHTKADSLYPLDPIFSLFTVSSFCAAMELCMMSNSNRTLAANSRCPVAIFCHRICLHSLGGTYPAMLKASRNTGHAAVQNGSRGDTSGAKLHGGADGSAHAAGKRHIPPLFPRRIPRPAPLPFPACLISHGCCRTQPRAAFSINIYFLQTAWLDSLQAVCVCFKACAVRRINSSPGAFLSVFETSTISW